MAWKHKNRQNPQNPKNTGASLVEALQQLVADMTKAASVEEADEGLRRLKELRGVYLDVPSGTPQTRKDAEALIAWVQSRLEQLRELMIRKRRLMEGEVVKKLAQEREAAAPSLLPTELIDAVVHFTDSREPEQSEASAPQPEPIGFAEGRKRSAGTKGREKKSERQKADAKAEPDGEPKPAEPEKTGWTKFEKLAAHLAAETRENPQFFAKLRESNLRRGPSRKAPEDDRDAEKYFRTLHNLNRRLVNLELSNKAIAMADKKQEELYPLLRSNARELRAFLKELKTGKAEMPKMASELDRIFGGWAESFNGILPEKGQDILSKCAAERQAKQKGKEQEPEAKHTREREAPQLVLKRDDWEQ